MTHARPQLSFVATLKCQVEGHEGFVDFNTAAECREGPECSLTPTLYLTANNYYNAPDIDASLRCDLHFRALQTPEGGVIYNIAVLFGDDTLQMVAQTRSGEIFLSPMPEPGLLEFWHLRSAPEPVLPEVPGKYAGVWLERYITKGEQAWLQEIGAQWPAGTGFYVQTRQDSGRYWNALFTAQKGDERIPFLGDLYVSHMGLYDAATMEPYIHEG